jgi:hypothetical protein
MTSWQAWWDDLGAAALVGTARRTPPEPPAGLPDDDAASPEERILTHAALGGALLRAGSRLSTAPRLHEPAGADTGPPAPARATKLLHLALNQPPTGKPLQTILVKTWLDQAIATGHRVPYVLLPVLFDLANEVRELRAPTMIAAGTRGRWLLDLNPDWNWSADPRTLRLSNDPGTLSLPKGRGMPDTPDLTDWATLPIATRAAIIAVLRESEPDQARELIESSWQSENAGDRLELISCLNIGLGPSDESFLEAALDDRARAVREAALDLLNQLPGSARADRMADRLRPLIMIKGRHGKSVAVALPDDPGPSGVRDGLGPAPPGESQRGHWLQELVAGSPLSLWTEVVGSEPDKIISMINSDDVRAGLVRAALAQGDRQWARALLTAGETPDLLPLLPAAEIVDLATTVLTRITDPREMVRAVGTLPAPWSSELSRLVLAQLERVARPGPTARLTFDPARQLRAELAAGLDRSVLPDLQELAAEHAPNHTYSLLVQQFTFLSAIEEAFR